MTVPVDDSDETTVAFGMVTRMWASDVDMIVKSGVECCMHHGRWVIVF